MKQPSEKSPFALPREEMQAIGYRIVDMIVDHFESVADKRPVTQASRQEMNALLQEPIPENPTPVDEVIDHIQTNVINNSAHSDHPRFYSFVPAANNIVSTFADALATGFNLFSGAWVSSPGAAELEILTTNWLLELFGFPIQSGGGLFVSGGSMANLTALVAARHHHLGESFEKGVVYWSDQTHSSVDRAAKIIGLKGAQIRRLPADKNFRLSLETLKSQIQQDLQDGLQPFLVVANAGTTNTGAVDPIPDISALCQQHKLWLHVDAAYGGGAQLCPVGKTQLLGIDLADSITIDPHKWFHQPYEIGCLLVRDHQKLLSFFQTQPCYLRDLVGASEELNFYDAGTQLTRRFRALKFYMSLKTYGLKTFRKTVEDSIELAETFEAEITQRPNWEVVSSASLAIINFRYRAADSIGAPSSESQRNALNQYLSDRIIADGKAMLATTVVNGKTVLRMCLINPRTTMTDLLSTLNTIESYVGDFDQAGR